MTTPALDYDAKCPGCDVGIGDHTIRGYAECLERAGFDYELPHEDNPGGPVRFPGNEGELAGEVTVMSAVLETRLGPVPALRFIFVAPGAEPMSRRPLPPITLVMDERGFDAFARLVRNSVKSAVSAALRRRAS